MRTGVVKHHATCPPDPLVSRPIAVNAKCSSYQYCHLRQSNKLHIFYLFRGRASSLFAERGDADLVRHAQTEATLNRSQTFIYSLYHADT